MSTSISIKAFSGKNSPEFQKHLKAVTFCIENNLSYPLETSNFFKGRIDSCDIEDYKRESVLQYIKEGIEVPLITSGDEYGNEIRIKVSDIPDEADEIIVELIG